MEKVNIIKNGNVGEQAVREIAYSFADAISAFFAVPENIEMYEAETGTSPYQGKEVGWRPGMKL